MSVVCLRYVVEEVLQVWSCLSRVDMRSSVSMRLAGPQTRAHLTSAVGSGRCAHVVLTRRHHTSYVW